MIGFLTRLLDRREPALSEATPRDAAAIAALHGKSFHRGWSDGEIESLLLDRNVIAHRAIVRLLFNTNYIDLGPDDVVGQAANASFDAATFEIWGALLHGGRLVGIEKDVVLSPRDLGARLAGDETVVQTGVSSGDTVITDGHLRLVPGSRISVKNSDAAKGMP